MALSAKLELRQNQTLVMTPQLMQAIKLLQLSNLDLVAYVDAELERNPLLERDESAEDGSGGEFGDSDAKADSSTTAEAGDAEWLDTKLKSDGDTMTSEFDNNLNNLYPDEPSTRTEEAPPALPAESWATTPSRKPVSSDDYNLEAFVAAEKTLADHLGDQLGLAVTDPTLRIIGRNLIDEIDESGYLRSDLNAIAERLGAPLEAVEEVLGIIQGFEPAGVAARDLRECLALQLKDKNRYDPAMACLVERLDLVARRDLNQLRRLCGVDEEDLAEMLAELKALDPKPGSGFGPSVVQPIIPDIFVRLAQDGGWHVELNTETLPRVLVNQAYHANIARNSGSEKDRAYLSDCLQTANWLVKSLDQRAKTILKVASEIVRQQDAFLAHGVQYLRPLNLKTIAEAIGMHESTVSRVTANKYMATARGTFELKYFFTAAIASAAGGDAHSAEAVRHRIRQMIEAETPDSILSDDTIVKNLRDSGIDIARRTVAKYREALKIPSSVQRRRDKLVGA